MLLTENISNQVEKIIDDNDKQEIAEEHKIKIQANPSHMLNNKMTNSILRK